MGLGVYIRTGRPPRSLSTNRGMSAPMGSPPCVKKPMQMTTTLPPFCSYRAQE